MKKHFLVLLIVPLLFISFYHKADASFFGSLFNNLFGAKSSVPSSSQGAKAAVDNGNPVINSTYNGDVNVNTTTYAPDTTTIPQTPSGGGSGSGVIPVAKSCSITSLSASSTNIIYNGKSTLSWKVTGACSSITWNGESVPVVANGSGTTSKTENVGPLTKTTTYTLAVVGTNGKQSKSVTVTVSPKATSIPATPVSTSNTPVPTLPSLPSQPQIPGPVTPTIPTIPPTGFEPCRATTTPSIKITSPVGGEIYQTGQTLPVQWTSCNVPASARVRVSIAAYNAQGTDWKADVNPATGPNSSGSITLAVPWSSTDTVGRIPYIMMGSDNQVKYNAPLGKYYKVTISAPVGNTTYMGVSNMFSIAAPGIITDICPANRIPSVTVLSPNGGEIYKAGQQVTVKWTSCNMPDGLKPTIILNDDVNSIAGTLLEDTANDGSETITLPTKATWGTAFKPGTFFKARVSFPTFGIYTDGSKLSDASDKLFTISDDTPSTGCTIDSFTANPTTISSGQSSGLTWNTHDCTNISVMKANTSLISTTSTAGDVSTGPLTTTTTFLLVASKLTPGCTGTVPPPQNDPSCRLASETVTVTVIGSSQVPPSVDLKINGSDNPTAVAYKSKMTATWTSTGTTSCYTYGTHVSMADAIGLWNNKTVGVSGSLGLAAAVGTENSTGGHVIQSYMSPLKVGIQCFYGSDMTQSVTDEVSVPVATETAPVEDGTPRIAYWYGKVNQHIDPATGQWMTDADGKSGANLDQLTYCKKWYPSTTSVRPYKSEMITTWKRENVYEQSSYTANVNSQECVQGSVSATPWIKVLTPQSGDIVSGQQPLVVKFTTSDGLKNDYLSVDLNAVDKTINHDITLDKQINNDGQESFDISTVSPGEYTISVYDPIASVDNKPVHGDSGVFTIGGSISACPVSTTKNLILHSPNGGEQYAIGDTMNITWDNCGFPSNYKVSIFLEDENKTAYENREAQIATNIPIDQRVYNFKIPQILAHISDNGKLGGNNYKIFITNNLVGSSGSIDYSDAPFSINMPSNGCLPGQIYSSTTGQPCPSAPSIKVITPNGGESYNISQQLKITWKTTNLPVNSNMQVSLIDDRTPGWQIGYFSAGNAPVLNFAKLISSNGVENTYEYSRTIPHDFDESLPAQYKGIFGGNHYTVELRAELPGSTGGSNLIEDGSDKSFSITPTVTTNFAVLTNTINGSNLTGEYLNGSGSTKTWFEWGTGGSTKLDSKTAPVVLTAINSQFSESIALTNGTSYYYRACAQDGSQDPLCGNVVNFATTGISAPTLPAGCLPGQIFSSTTGQPCNGLRTSTSPTTSTTSSSSNVVVSANATQACSAPVFTATLRPGQKGNQVEALQKILSSQGYLTGVADGSFGTRTQVALKAFQKANGVLVTGYTGSTVRSLLNTLASKQCATDQTIQ
jgi:hypothetical protein